jgi:MFS transporter, PPP family, 3-phenylpropionic acid transporter
MSTSFRLSLYYALLFAAVGTHLPFWPVWLAERGLSAAQIGMVTAAAYLARMVFSPAIGAIVDRRGDRRRPMVILAAAAALCWALFAATDSLPAIVVLTFIAGGLWSAVIPVGDSLAMMAAIQRRLDYGRVRLWGSAAFIVAAVGVGRLLTQTSPSVLVWLITGWLTATAAACAVLPDLRATSGGVPAPFAPLLSSRAFLLFIACAAANQAAHTAYYAFSTLHWRHAGIPDDVIGLLWSEGVIAEIVLFSMSGRVVAKLGPAGLLIVAGLGGVLRWLVLGTTTALPALAVAQILHAATFGCAHLGAMHFLQRAVPAGLSVRAQGLYAAVALGAVPGLMSPVAGHLFENLGGGVFFAMAGFSLAAALLGGALARGWHGGKVVDATIL